MQPNNTILKNVIRRILIQTFSLFAILAGSGCAVHVSTVTERSTSFAPYADTNVGAQNIRDFALLRYAFIMSAEDLVFKPSETGEVSFTAAKDLSYGSAAAADSRGYFLTAAHCVKDSPPYLVFRSSGKLRVERARVVWRGDASRKEPDIAILHVSHPVDHVFSWAHDLKVGDTVLGVGPSYEKSLHMGAQCFAGRTSKLTAKTQTEPHHIVISHTGPGRLGDSWGPLLSSDGRLLGINVRVGLEYSIPRLSFEQWTYAIQPDLVWLADVIDRDFTKSSAPATSS